MAKNGQEKLSQFFNRKGIYLLMHPRERLPPGFIYKSEQDDTHLQPFGKLATILQHKNDTSKSYELPAIEKDTSGVQLVGAIKNETNISIALEFFKNFFDKIKGGLGLAISGKASNSSILNATYDMSTISTESIETAELIDSVSDYIIKPNFQLNYSNSNYYIVTRTWYSKTLQIMLGNLSQTDIEFLGKATGDVSAEVKFIKITDDTYKMECNKMVAFGVNVASLRFDRIAVSTEVNIVPHDKHLVPFAEVETIQFKDIDSEITLNQ